ncbi:MAG: response regulator [Candidatus Rokuibacteriota bacterium]|jgi:CheY-like chemotaxis protein|nr:MAG: response regulator [Candidatus Rokubacteria bacterium]
MGRIACRETMRVEGGIVSNQTAAATPVAAPLVLVADDEPVIRDLVCDILHESGYRTLPASNGKEAIDLAQRHLPSLIVLDLMMPAMDGYTTMTRLRRDPGTARIPVIVITGHSDPSYRSLSEGIGATAHVTKPFSARGLVETVRRALGERPE